MYDTLIPDFHEQINIVWLKMIFLLLCFFFRNEQNFLRQKYEGLKSERFCDLCFVGQMSIWFGKKVFVCCDY